MRPNHGNNKRMRGRHRNNKPSNPLARSYESNGPDVKVRGNPQHIVEKYSQLARDAQVSGDPVLAEAYLQHAEHYYRIITAAQAAIAQAQGFGRPENEADESGEDDDDMGGFQQPYPDFRQQQTQPQRNDPGEQPQPDGGQPPFQQRERQNFGERQSYGDRGERQDRGDRQSYGDRQDRPFNDRQDRPYNDRQDRQNFGERQAYGDRQDRGDRQPYGERGDRGDRRFPPRGQRQDFRPRRPEPEPDGAEAPLPSFITGGAPRPVNGGEPDQPTVAPIVAAAPEREIPASEPPVAVEAGEGEARSPYRARRRRRTPDAKTEDLPLDSARPEGQPAE